MLLSPMLSLRSAPAAGDWTVEHARQPRSRAIGRTKQPIRHRCSVAVAEDAGNGRIDFRVSRPEETTAAHIHCCTLVPGSANVGVATMLPSFAGFPLGVTSGTYDNTFDMAVASSYNPAFITLNGGIGNAFIALNNAMATGNAYFNLHTNLFPAGEIRGLLFAVPEPATYGLMLGGLGLLVFSARRRKLKEAA